MKPTSGSKGPQHRASAQHGGIRRTLLFVLGALGLGVGLYALAGFFGGPWLVDRWLAQYRAAGPERMASRAELRFNPFTLVAEIGAFETRDDQAGTAFAADRLVVDLTVRSLAELRPVVSSIVIERPRIAVASVGQLSALGRRVRSTALHRTRIDRLDLTGGTFTAGLGTDRPVELTRLDLSLTGFDGRSGTNGRFSLDALSATNAGIVGVGAITADLERADGQLRLSAIELGAAADRLGGTIGSVGPRGRVDLSADFSATSLLAGPRLELTNAGLELSGLALTPAAGLTVTADSADAVGRFVLAATDDGIELGGRLEVESARLSVNDARVIPPQSFAFDEAAILTTIDADSDELSLSLGGQLTGAGEATVTIRVPPGAAGGARVSIEAAGLPATMLSAYAVDTLGRRLAAGDTDLRVEYALTGNRVDGSLRIVTRGLAFSEQTAGQTPADGGPSLELAAALLENANGVIEMQLPFASNTGTVRAAAAAALEARIAAVTETPFDTLAPLIGDEGADAMPFLPGDAALNDRALVAIGRLADALNARPRLGLKVYAGYDPRVDRDALAKQQIELHVQLATAGPGESARPADVDLGSARVRDVLDEFAGERLPAERVAELRGRYECEGALASVCERVYYESIFDALVTNEEIAPTALNRLGRFRALSVIDALGERGIANERIELVTGGEVVDTPFGIGLPVELAAVD
jgi:hypothetical protein